MPQFRAGQWLFQGLSLCAGAVFPSSKREPANWQARKAGFFV